MSNTNPTFAKQQMSTGLPVSSVGTRQYYGEGDLPFFLAPAATVFDAELAALNGGAGNYAGATLKLQRAGGASAEDVFAGVGSLSLNGGMAVIDGVNVGSVINGGGTLFIAFNGSATQYLVNELVSHIGYANTSETPPYSLKVNWTLTDGSGSDALSVTDSTPVTIFEEDDPTTGGVALVGDAIVGQKLVVANTIADADGIRSIHIDWLVDGVVQYLPGATDTGYTVRWEDLGKKISVSATYEDSQHRWGVMSSAPTATVVSTRANNAPTGSVTMAGEAKQGQTLTASNTLADADGMGTVSYQWLRAGQGIAGATGSSFTLTQADVGQAISVRASYTDQRGMVERVVSSDAVVTNVNDAPTGSFTISGPLVEGGYLRTVSTIADADGMPANIRYQWLRDGVDVRSGLNWNHYELSRADVGHTFVVRMTYVDLHGTTETLTTAATGRVVLASPMGPSQIPIGGTPVQGQVLTAAPNLIDPDGLGAAPANLQWLRDGVAVSGATSLTYMLGQADVGHTLSMQASYIDNKGVTKSFTGASTATVLNLNDAPMGQVDIAGLAAQGQTLTASHTLSDVDGMGQVSYQWLRAGKAIAGATGQTYTLTQADVGLALTVKASYVDGFNTAESRSSTATLQVANVNDAATGEVSISGSAAQGQTLTAAHTLADADGLGAVKYQWLRDGAAITGATAGTYALGQADVGRAISVRASYVDKLGTAEAVTSAATAAVANVNDAPAGGVTVGGLTKQGSVLSAVTAKLADADGLGALSYQWLRGGVAVDGATAATYTTTQADVGQALSVRVSYTDGQGTAESVTSTATAAVANVNDAATGGVTVSGTAEVGRTLSAGVELQDLDGLGTVALQWLRGGVAIAGATGAGYTLTTADAAQAISVRASFVDLLGGKEAVTSAATAAVAYPGDTVTGTAGADVLRAGLGASLVDGGAGHDSVWGELGNDTVRGGEGNDTLYGGAGNDVLQGDAGDDRLLGGVGVDTLTGGEGRDSFAFTALAELGATPATADVIADFVRGQDRLDLAGLDANTATSGRDAFSSLIDAGAAFTAAGQLKLADGVLYGNTDADADVEFAIRLLGVSALELSDFVLR